MAYEKLNFAPGQVLTAAQMNHIEEGIAQAEAGIPAVLPSPQAIKFLQKSDSAVIGEYSGATEMSVELADDAYIENVAKELVTWANIPDKPFGQIGYEGIVMDGVMVALDPESGEGFLANQFVLYENVNYVVIWNNSYYQCTGKRFDVNGIPAICLGNLSVLGSEEGNPHAPFILICVPKDMWEEIGGTGIVMAMDGSTEASLRIASLNTYLKINEELIPESIARVEQVENLIDVKLGAIENGTY